VFAAFLPHHEVLALWAAICVSGRWSRLDLPRNARDYFPNFGLRNSELLGNPRWCNTSLEGGSNCVQLARRQRNSCWFHSLTYDLFKGWQYFPTPLLLSRHRGLQLLKLMIIKVSNCSWQIIWQDVPRSGVG